MISDTPPIESNTINCLLNAIPCIIHKCVFCSSLIWHGHNCCFQYAFATHLACVLISFFFSVSVSNTLRAVFVFVRRFGYIFLSHFIYWLAHDTNCMCVGGGVVVIVLYTMYLYINDLWISAYLTPSETEKKHFNVFSCACGYGYAYIFSYLFPHSYF